MATCEVSQKLHDECSICLNEFQTPKALPCLHTFCQKCLQNYVNRNFNLRDESFLCPVCRAKHKPRFIIENGSNIPVKQIVKHLPTNFYINPDNNQQKGISKTEHESLNESSFENMEQFEKQIYHHKKKIEQQYRRNRIWAHSLKEGLRFCPKNNQSQDSFENRVKEALSDELSSVQKKHDSLDKSLMDLEKIRVETVSLIMHKDKNRKQKKRQKNSKTPANSFDIKQSLNTFKRNLKSTFEQLTISESQNELKTLMDQMQLQWMNPEWEGSTLFPKITDQDSKHTFPMINELLYICSVKVLDDDTVVVCGKSPNLLLCYDANNGLLKSRYKLSDEPTNMFVYDYYAVLVTFRNSMIIINVRCQPPNIERKLETKIYSQVLFLNNDDLNTVAILALFTKDAYNVLEFKNGVDTNFTLKNKGHIPDRYPGSQMAYMKQRNIVLYPDKNRKCLLAFGLSSNKIEFKYDGDAENPLVVISSVCCSESFIFITDKRHYKVHKLSFYGRSLEIIQCYDFGIMWPLHIHVNQYRTMVICSQKKDSSYVMKTFLC